MSVIVYQIKKLVAQNIMVKTTSRSDRPWSAIFLRNCLLVKQIRGLFFVGSTARASSQQLQMWFSEHFFVPKRAALFVTPTVSATVEQIWREKMSENHIPFNF